MNGRHLAAVVAAVWIGLLLPSQAETVTLRFGQIPSTVRGTSSVYLHIAEQKGFFAREEIKLERTTIPGGTDKMVVALEQGVVDVTQTATPYLIQAVLGGSEAVGIASETANPIYSLIVKPEIASFADLKGKLLGLSLPIDTISISMRKLLALKGLGAADYRVKELVGTPVRFECLRRGECDGVPLVQPDDLIALTQGYRRLGLSTEAVSAVPVPASGGEALMGRGQQGRCGALRPRHRVVVPVHARSGKPRRGHQDDGGSDGLDRGHRRANACALL
jgi:ABC-type nitrate/sulfonate/bicarbonate transport system substrate-binding protein